MLEKMNISGNCKTEIFDFASVGELFNHLKQNKPDNVLPEQTKLDLTFNDLFVFVDRTCSRIGQQWLYNCLLTIPKLKNEICNNENIISNLLINEKHS